MRPEEVLFIGLGDTRVCFYRCLLPAMYMGADWIGAAVGPPKIVVQTGYVRGGTAMPNFADYKIVVIQQPQGQGWLRMIRELRDHGVKVIYEIDDYVHAIRRMKKEHDFAKSFDLATLKLYEECMAECDGMICSTEWLAAKYRQFNPNVHVCENGLDLGRFRLTRPERTSTNVGWAGATGHTKHVIPWLQATANVMVAHPEVCFVSIGQPFASALLPHFGPRRCLDVPFTMVELYPAPMTMFDIALAPAGRNGFARAKSQLRFYEAGALGIPIIADPRLYSEVQDGVTGLHASTGEGAQAALELLVGDERLRRKLGEAAREYVVEHHDMHVAVGKWARALTALSSE